MERLDTEHLSTKGNPTTSLYESQLRKIKAVRPAYPVLHEG